jgi:hypothetical protein
VDVKGFMARIRAAGKGLTTKLRLKQTAPRMRPLHSLAKAEPVPADPAIQFMDVVIVHEDIEGLIVADGRGFGAAHAMVRPNCRATLKTAPPATLKTARFKAR